MNDVMEFLDGAIRVTPFGVALCVLLFSIYIGSWIFWSRRSGVVLPFVHWYLLVFLVLPTYIIYPFCSSEVNLITVGADIYALQDTIELALVITSLGGCSLLLGYLLWPSRYASAARSPAIEVTGWRRALEEAFLSRRVVNALLVGITVLSVGLLAATLPRTGFTFDLRAEFLLDPTLRAMFNFWYSLYIYITTIALLGSFGAKRAWVVLLVLSPSIFLAFISGSRTIALLPFMYFIVIYSEVRAALRFRGLLITLVSVLVIAITLYQVRQADGAESVDVDGVSPFLFSILYGNTFSDLRDFALVLSAWDGNHLAGKSYLAGIMGFVPRSLSDFREIYSIGVYTNAFLGYDSTVHPGVRMGMFGEPYLNFSYLGVVLVGATAGAVFRSVNDRLAAWRERGRGGPLMRGYVELLPAMLISNIFVSAAMWSLYIFAALSAFALFIHASEGISRKVSAPNGSEVQG